MCKTWDHGTRVGSSTLAVIGKIKGGFQLELECGKIAAGGIVHVMDVQNDTAEIKIPASSLTEIHPDYETGTKHYHFTLFLLASPFSCYHVFAPLYLIEMSPITISYRPTKNRLYLFINYRINE